MLDLDSGRTSIFTSSAVGVIETYNSSTATESGGIAREDPSALVTVLWRRYLRPCAVLERTVQAKNVLHADP